MPRHTGTTRGASSSRGSGRGSGSRGSGAQGSAEERETKISKAMSYVLRHGAEKEGVRLDENGYANVAELVSFFHTWDKKPGGAGERGFFHGDCNFSPNLNAKKLTSAPQINK